MADPSTTPPNDNQGEGAAGQARAAFEPAERAGEAFQASGRQMVQNGSAIGVTMIDQAEVNAREAFAAMRAAAGAKDINEVMRIQTDFLRDQGTRAMTQAREIGELIARFGRDAVSPMGKGR